MRNGMMMGGGITHGMMGIILLGTLLVLTLVRVGVILVVLVLR